MYRIFWPKSPAPIAARVKNEQPPVSMLFLLDANNTHSSLSRVATDNVWLIAAVAIPGDNRTERSWQTVVEHANRQGLLLAVGQRSLAAPVVSWSWTT